MDGRPRTRRGARGGEVVQTLRTARARLILGLLAVVAYGGVIAWSCALAPKLVGLTATIGSIGGLLLLFVLARDAQDLLGSSVLAAGACYVLGLLAGHHSLDQSAPLVAGALLACTELATWSLDETPHVTAPRSLTLARAGAVGVLVLAGTVAAALVLATGASSFGSGLGWTLVGAAAAVGALAAVVRLSSR